MTVAPYVAPWPEELILQYVWTAGKDPEVDRIALLRQIAPIILQRPEGWSTADVRLEHEQASHKMAKQCWCCLTGDRRLYWHHVIQVQHGGSNRWENLVPICLRCHAAVHPHLNADEPNQQRRKDNWFSPASIDPADALQAVKVEKKRTKVTEARMRTQAGEA